MFTQGDSQPLLDVIGSVSRLFQGVIMSCEPVQGEDEDSDEASEDVSDEVSSCRVHFHINKSNGSNTKFST